MLQTNTPLTTPIYVHTTLYTTAITNYTSYLFPELWMKGNKDRFNYTIF